MNEKTSSHFEGKSSITHVIEKRAEGVAAFSEAHGTEIPGHLSAGADAARETGIVFLLLGTLFSFFHLSNHSSSVLFIVFAASWTVWKIGRSAWLAWSRLERLHRLIAQEKFEIENHRDQEREELTALYRAKGFEGELLENVINVLMADGDRLLKVMLEEELGLTLETHEHPLKQALGAAIGAFFASALIISSFILLPSFGLIMTSFAIIAIGASVSAKFEGNQIIPSIIWNLAITGLCYGILYFLIQSIM